MNTPRYLPAVREYAEAVRAGLEGLEPADIADMTDGLEADLVAALEDSDSSGEDAQVLTAATMTERFGPPEDYVKELLQAAGLSEHAPDRKSKRSQRRGRRETRRREGRTLKGLVRRGIGRVRSVRTLPWWPKAAAFGRVMAPAWWVLRAWAMFSLISEEALPRTAGGFFVLAGLLIASLLLGQVRWGEQTRWLRATMLIANCALVVIAGVAIDAVNTRAGNAESTAQVLADLAAVQEASGEEFMEGATDASMYTSSLCARGDGPLCVGGREIRNVFAYDAAGEPIDLVQLFDEEGEPLMVVNDEDYEAGAYREMIDQIVNPTTLEVEAEIYSDFSPAKDNAGRALWNVFPLHTGSLTEWMDGTITPRSKDEAPKPPLRLAPEVSREPEAEVH
ncbi:MAG: hypothetical protein LBH48_07330 [Bifidobacteriaceae bacterium]|jgi:hypothetical protein|nr:hypothetical protein [Bifidobacteriaceae bacterium]